MTETTQPHAGQEVVLVIGLHLKAGAEAEFMALLTPVLDAMRHEPTFVNTVLHRDPEDPRKLMLYETWADMADLVEVQVNKPYRAAYTARLDDLLESPRTVQVWTRLRADFTFHAA